MFSRFLVNLSAFVTGLHFLGVHDFLIALVLALAADEEDVLGGVGEHVEGLTLSLLMTDMTGGEGLEVGDLLGRGGLHRAEPGLDQVALLFLKMLLWSTGPPNIAG